jgi:hypothetical protein
VQTCARSRPGHGPRTWARADPRAARLEDRLVVVRAGRARYTGARAVSWPGRTEHQGGTSPFVRFPARQHRSRGGCRHRLTRRCCIGTALILHAFAGALQSARSAFRRASSNGRFHDRQIASGALPRNLLLSGRWAQTARSCIRVEGAVGVARALGGIQPFEGSARSATASLRAVRPQPAAARRRTPTQRLRRRLLLAKSTSGVAPSGIATRGINTSLSVAR